MSALMGFTFVAVYFIGGGIRNILFLPLLYLAFRSEKKFFWFAYLFLLLNTPAFFFARTTVDALHRLPLYSVISGISFAFTDLLLIVLAFTTLQDWFARRKLIVATNVKLIGFYFLLISLPLTFLFGTSILDFANKLRFVAFYAGIPIAFSVLGSKENIYRFIYLMVPYIFIIIADQFYVVYTGIHYVETLDYGAVRFMPNSETGGIRPIPGGINILLLTMIFGLFMDKESRLFRGFGELLFAAGFMAFFISATRTMTAMGIVMLVVFTVLSKNGFKNLLAPIIGFALIFQILTISGLLQSQVIDDAMARMELFAKLTGGVDTRNVKDLDTFGNRVENEVPIVMAGIARNPVFGVGLSEYFHAHYNNDVGFFNTILMLGYAGFTLFLLVVANLFLRMYAFRGKMPDEVSKNQMNGMIAAWAAVMTGYIFTWDFFQFYPHKVIFVAVLLALPDLFWKEALKKQEQAEAAPAGEAGERQRPLLATIR